jgi:alkylhydroperoxidase/carboxymuconolactone decarboxylase family protein YurZ
MKIGVTAPGSSTNMFVNVLLAKAGLKSDAVAIIGVGATAGAVAIMKRGEIDAISNLDPVISQLESDGSIVPVIDTRTAKGMQEFTNTMTFSGGPSSNPFQEAINNFVFGEMWWRPGLDERARRWVTLVGVANSAADIPIRSHFHAGMASGNCTREEMLEFSLQYGIHAGWPRASLVNMVIMQMAAKVEAGLPWNG